MPYINIKIGTRLTDAQKTILFEQTTNAMNQVMGKRSEVTVVQIETGQASDWSVHGVELDTQAPIAAYVDVKITQQTNSDEQKAVLIQTLMQMLQKSVGIMQTACYVVIHEISATSWGYDGRTQAARLADR